MRIAQGVMATSLRTSLLAILLVTSLAPLAGLAYFELSKLDAASERENLAAREQRALLAAIRADAAKNDDEDPLVAASIDAPRGGATYLVQRDATWRGENATTGTAPDLLAAIGDRLSGTLDFRDPRTGEPAEIAWARAPGLNALIVLSNPPAPRAFVPDLAFIAVAGFLAAGAILVASTLTARVVRPIARLEAATRKLDPAGLPQPVPVEGSREVQALATSFNEMEKKLTHQRGELLAYAEELDRLVADRTRSLSESRSDVEAFLFTIAHELREPMRSMRTMTDAVLRDSDAKEALEAMGLLHGKIEHLERVLLDVMRFDEAARRDEQLTLTDLGVLVQRAVEMMRGKGDAIGVDVGPLPQACVRPGLLTEALAELLINAARHAGEGKVRVSGTSEGGDVTVIIGDEGPGIPAERREDAFHLFQRLRVDSQGTGVGLAIVRRIVERHDGSVHLENSLRGGLRVVLRLPEAGPEPRAPEPPSDRAPRAF